LLLHSSIPCSRNFSNDRCDCAYYILGMETILPFLLGAAMLATLGVLFAGVISFAFNTKTNAKYSTKLMTARVVCQAVAVALFGAMVLLNVL
jgi:Hypoxia induced protein conserved region